MDSQQLERIRAAFEQERTHLEEQLAAHGAAVEGDDVELTTDEGFADSAHATTERSQMLSLIEQLHSSHAEILEALKRIDDGTYGMCQNCGNPIPLERLEAVPQTALCVTCKQASQAS